MTELGLALGFDNHFIHRGLNNDSGAGANAGSRTDMTFVTANPISELVWSPSKGLSLKCADCSLPEKKPFPLWGTGSSNMVFSPPQSITVKGANNERPVAEGNWISSQTAFHLERPGGDMEKLNTDEVEEENYSDKKAKGVNGPTEDQTTSISGTRENIMLSLSSKASAPGPENGITAESLSVKMDESKPVLARIRPGSGNFNRVLSSDPFDISRDVGIGDQIAGMEVSLASEGSIIKQCKAPNIPVPISTFPDTKLEALASVIEEHNKNKMKALLSPLEKQESTAESDLQPLNGESAFAEVGKMIASQPVNEVKHSPQQNEKIFPKEKASSINAFPNKSRLQLCRRKDKGKALSYGEVNGGVSKEDDDSHESVESCNSAGLFSAGKRPRRFEQQLVIGSKRVKKQNQESPSSTSFIRQDSSFRNWISNMMNGLSKPDQDEAPSVALTMTNHNAHESPNQKFISHDKNQDPGCRNIGFRTIFQGIYCPSPTVQETRTWDFDHQMGEGSNELETNKICDNSTIPIACGEENDNICKQLLTSADKFNHGTSGDGEGPSTQPNISSANLRFIQATRKTNTVENINSCNMACGTEKGKVASNVALIDPNKSSNSATHGSGPLGSLWIARFSSKVSVPRFNLPQCSHSTGSADRKDLEEARELSVEDQMDVVGNNWQNCVVNTKASLGLGKIKGQADQKFKSKLNPILHSQRFKRSEAMASVFARRLDALRHIIPSGITDNATRETTTCFFCGIRGHNLQECSEITETELEDLLKNVNSYSGAEDSPCLCIRCFQLNHWAVACPNTSSRSSASLVNYSSFSKRENNPGNNTLNNSDGRNLKLMENKDSRCLTSDGKNPRMDADLILYANLNKNSSEIMASNERISDSEPVKKHIDSRCGKNELKENQITPLYNFVKNQIPAVPKGTFEAIRRLRLSRTDILRWMKSPVSLFCLDGFFLRLRLGKWEEGLGGTGYYVACVNGALSEISSGSSKTPLSVNIGGVKCSVECKYVSNHDFVEEELNAWWCALSRGGGKLPSEEDLKMKLDERKKLGF
ncbi:hypothetical protein HHK36_020532 [Tetracentron sinense]|uniref:Plus3 domain-containing protein n=1 Tax=Tetracentron sinense TaxID=13715 RepID=A0A835DBP7_TETSI|nr:hypothetical protein HHK36_020532 [Tetracentron sinense]